MEMDDSDYENSFDDEDEDVGLLKQALHVEIPEDFDPNKAPQTGEEYLQHVVYERKKCKAWLTADIDRSKFENQQTFKIQTEKNIKSTPASLLPTLEWQTQKLQEFSSFCKFVHYKIEKEPTVTTFEEDTFLERVQTKGPLFSEVTVYSQSAKMRMLNIISKFVDTIAPGESIGEEMGTWIYALLSLLEKPLSPDSCFSLREFAKRCMKVRANLDENASEDLINPLNLFICIVGRFYNQLDLADS